MSLGGFWGNFEGICGFLAGGLRDLGDLGFFGIYGEFGEDLEDFRAIWWSFKGVPSTPWNRPLHPIFPIK